jgi:hypothetical protein
MADFEVYVPRVLNDRGIIGVGTNDFLASDLRKLQRVLKEIDPELRRQLVRDAKAVGKEAESIVKPKLPVDSPFSNKRPSQGAYGWNTQERKGKRVAPNKTEVRFRTATGGNTAGGKTSLVSVRVVAPMTVIADIAGRSGDWTGKGNGSGYSRPYADKYGNIRRHKLNGQGEAMIAKLGGQGSRYAWPALEGRKAELESKVQDVVQKYQEIANRRFI